MWSEKTDAHFALLIKPKITARLSDALFIGKPVKISDLHNIKDFSFGFFGHTVGVFGPLRGIKYINWDLAGLQLKTVFGSNYFDDFRPFPFCQEEWIVCSLRESIWTVILNPDATCGHAARIEDSNSNAPNCWFIGGIKEGARITEIHKSAISQSRGLVGLF